MSQAVVASVDVAAASEDASLAATSQAVVASVGIAAALEDARAVPMRRPNDATSKDLLAQIADLKRQRTELSKEKKLASKALKVMQKKLQRLKSTLKKFDEASLFELLSLRVALKKD